MTHDRRVEDQGTFAKVLSRLSHWHGALAVISTLVSILVLGWITLGFGFPTTPRSQFVDLSSRVDTLSRSMRATDSATNVRVDSIAHQHSRMLMIMRILAVDACLRLSPVEARRAQLPCEEVMHPQYRENGL